MLYSTTIRLIYVHQLETLYLYYMVKCQSGVIWGHFHLKSYNLSNLHSLTIRLIHVHQLLTLYLSYGVKYQSRVIWGHWGQKVIFTKHDVTHPCYLA